MNTSSTKNAPNLVECDDPSPRPRAYSNGIVDRCRVLQELPSDIYPEEKDLAAALRTVDVKIEKASSLEEELAQRIRLLRQKRDSLTKKRRQILSMKKRLLVKKEECRLRRGGAGNVCAMIVETDANACNDKNNDQNERGRK